MDDSITTGSNIHIPESVGKNSLWQKFRNLSRRNKILIGVVMLTVVGLIGWSLYKYYNPQPQKVTQVEPWNVGPKFPVNEKVAQVGGETIYGGDLNYKIYSNYQVLKNAPRSEIEKVKPEIIGLIASESAMLQAAQDQNIVAVPVELLNNPQKNQVARKQLLKEISEIVKKDSSLYTYSGISIWYYNMLLPKLGVATAERVAKTKIDQLYDKLVNNQISMKQAGDLIKTDTSLANLDINYQGNAYQLVENAHYGIGPSRFDQVNQVALKLLPGEISPVIKAAKVGRPIPSLDKITYTVTGDMDVNEQFYTIIKLESLKSGKYMSLRDWINEALNKYHLTNVSQ